MKLKARANPRTGCNIQRFRFSFSGIPGLILEPGAACVLHYVFKMAPALAFFAAILLNEIFHHVFYHLIYVNREIRMRTPLLFQLLLYTSVALAGAILLWILLAFFPIGFVPAVVLCIVILSLLNVLLIRISTFSSASLAEVEYREMNESYYHDQADESKVSKFRAWYHRSRYERLARFVMEYSRPGLKVVDLGCGNCLWNVHGIPVLGVDINSKMLSWAKKNRRLEDFRVTTDLSQTDLPAKSFDLVVMTEVLEHLLDLKGTLAEVRRILNDQGDFLVTVPYDFFLGPFFILFNMNCLFQGHLKGSVYHRYRCGHVNHFTISRMKRTLSENDFRLERLFIVNGLLLYAAARKQERPLS
jgi:SAM-dependent methyltransferase